MDHNYAKIVNNRGDLLATHALQLLSTGRRNNMLVAGQANCCITCKGLPVSKFKGKSYSLLAPSSSRPMNEPLSNTNTSAWVRTGKGKGFWDLIHSHANEQRRVIACDSRERKEAAEEEEMFRVLEHIAENEDLNLQIEAMDVSHERVPFVEELPDGIKHQVPGLLAKFQCPSMQELVNKDRSLRNKRYKDRKWFENKERKRQTSFLTLQNADLSARRLHLLSISEQVFWFFLTQIQREICYLWEYYCPVVDNAEVW